MSSSCSQYLRNIACNGSNIILNSSTRFDDKNITYSDLEQYLLHEDDIPAVTVLHKLCSQVKESFKHMDSNILPDTTVDLLIMFSQETSLLMKHYIKVKEKYGNINFDTVQSIFTIVQEFKNVLSNGCADIFNSTVKAFRECDLDGSIPIIYNSNCDVINKIKKLEIKTPENINAVKNFSMLYTQQSGENAYNNSDTKVKQKNYSIFDSVKEYNITEYSDDVFCSKILDILVTSENDLESALYNFFGFETWELLDFLQKNKSSILKHSGQSVSKQQNGQSMNKHGTTQPSYGAQVTVQSKQEKELSKQLRKIEKKKPKTVTPDEYNQIKTEYSKASVAPLFTPKRVVKEEYPNVHDAGNVGRGHTPVSLAGFTRKDNDGYEEITVPPQSRNTMPKITEYVPINKLDDIGQMIFRNVTKLNMIQSMVFPVAYTTNENMLICAPTGAGKTNIALLTIAHQIRKCAVNGIVDRNSFKIVYVVPMKALAAEITANFSAKLSPLGMVVKELTGDMQLSKKEIKETQLIVTTPEKWDVITRKGSGDNGFIEFLKLLIIDEIHLLHGMRGPVIEALVARTLRQVEATQSMIRIVGLSATLPNYIDVARFLNVNPYIGLFYFDGRFRPVPLTQVFIGIKPMKPHQVMQQMDHVCFLKVLEFLKNGHQVMVFVHARNQTVHTATVLKEKAKTSGCEHLFQPPAGIAYTNAKRQFGKSPNSVLAELLSFGFSIHHAGLLRTDRNMIEKYFREGVIRVLVCTATLAWGVNLPAHGVIIRGTEVYDSRRGTTVPLDMLDVLQIFGRAGRPQYDVSGTGVIITTHEFLNHYLRLFTHQIPIESSFLEHLPDHLNAEIVLGTVSNVNEAIEWLSYTYLQQRLTINPHAYGIDFVSLRDDNALIDFRKKFIRTAAEALDKAHMIRFNRDSGDFVSTDLGRTASHYYINYDTVQLFNNCIEPFMTEKDILAMISRAEEFVQLMVRKEECDELDALLHKNCELAVPGGTTDVFGKVNILMQTYLSRGFVKSFALVSDMAYITQNVVRIARALFDIALHQNNPTLAGRCLMVAQMFELQQWDFQSPLRQFTQLNHEIIDKLERYNLTVERIRDEDVKYLTSIFKNNRYATLVKKCAAEYPFVDVDSSIQPITRSVLRIKLTIYANFVWNDKVHGSSSESFWLWIEDPDNNTIYYSENFVITKYNVCHGHPIELAFTVPLVEPQPAQYFAKITSERWLGSSHIHSLSFRGLVLPESHPPHTDLLELRPLPLNVLKNKQYEELYKFSHFNPIQTQIFHCLYHTDNNILVGAPTGSGKTIISELAMLRLFSVYPNQKVVYIAPLKALVRERVQDWKGRFEQRLNKKVTELTGDVNPNIKEILNANIIITTPEKWDGLSRSWQSRNYVKQVGLMIIDEIHLLGEDRGPVLEVIVSRTNFISANTNMKLRVVGLSTAMANARDLANWLGIKEMGLYNFRPSVRPVPLEVHISGYPGKHYCPRMISMNKPTFQAIRMHAPDSPSLVFVSSRRQTRLTAQDLLSFLAAETDSKAWLHMPETEMNQIVATIRDSSLKLCLPFGIGIHHAGLEDHDRRITEELFVNQKIQVLIATATLAWGVNFPAHLVVIKGTEFFNAKIGRYEDMPITDVLQMMGRAGRPQFDTNGVAVVLVHDIKKNFYKKFLYEPFPVESSLLQVMPDHVNAEIVAGTIRTKSELLEYLTWTYFFRRLIQNPTYYNLPSLEKEDINGYLDSLSQATLDRLIDSYCIDYNEDTLHYSATPLGQIASFYYLSNETMRHFQESMKHDLSHEYLLHIISRCHEYSEFPVRHNEDLINSDLAGFCRLKANDYTSPHTKVFLLLQAHFSRLPLPITDYKTDLKSALEQVLRITQALIDVSANLKWLSCTLKLQQLLQMAIQGCWIDDSPMLQLYDFDENTLERLLQDWRSEFPNYCEDTLSGILNAYKMNKETFMNLIQSACGGADSIKYVTKILETIPRISVSCAIYYESENIAPDVLKTIMDGNRIHVETNKEYSIKVTLRRFGKKSATVSARHYPKTKDEMWFLNLGYRSTDTLIAVKRVSVNKVNSCTLNFVSPTLPGDYSLSLFFISDCYVGLDQQYNIDLKVLRGA